jgi:hypothetical protein
MTFTVDSYTKLITNQYADQPKFKATVEAVCQPLVDLMNEAAQFVNDFDIDFAIGVQLDKVGLWIGQSRIITVAIQGVFFTWNDPNIGTTWDVGAWKGVGQADNTTTTLNDDEYRALLKSKILANNWKGDAESVYPIIDAFVITPTPITVTDNQDMTQTVTLPQAELTQNQIDVIVNGYLQITPAGVKTNYVLV